MKKVFAILSVVLLSAGIASAQNFETATGKAKEANEALLAGVNEAIAAALADGSMDKFVADANELASGNIDCIWNGFTMNGRENAYTWTKPYCENVQVVMVLKDAPINTLADLKDKIVAAQTDTPILKALSEGGDLYEKIGKTFKKIIVTPSYNNAVQELQTGAVDAIAMDSGVAQGKLESGNYRILKETLMNEQYGIGFKLGNTELKDKVEATLIEMVKDGTAAKISAKYFKGEDHLTIGKDK